MEFIIKKFASSITDKTSKKKKIDYLYFLPLISKLNYEKALFLAKKRGLAITEKYKTFFDISKKNIKNFLNVNDYESENIAKKMFIKSSYEELEACIIANKNEKFLTEYVDIKGEEFVYDAFKKRKGVVLTIIHAGSFASVLCKTAYIFNNKIFNAISWDYRTSECPITKEFLRKKMEGMNYFYRGEYFFVGKINPKKLFHSLQNGEVLIIAIDAPLGNSQFVKIKFLGKDVSFPYSAIKIAHRTNSFILPLAVYREGIKIIGEYYPPFLINDNNYSKYLQNIFTLLEKNIYNHPDEFFYWTSPTSWRTIDIL